jgi:shikimate dehydrogenase
LLGHPVSHSLSPVFQNAALRAAKIPLKYEALDVAPAELRSTLRELSEAKAAGNITIPHKTAVHASCDKVSEVADRVGAVNTFWFQSADLHCDNTDVAGFDSAVRALVGGDPINARVVLIGSGGAAAAVLAAAERWQNARVKVVARNAEKARKLTRRFRDVASAETNLEKALVEATLIVNATPIGQHDDEQPVDVEMIEPTTAVFDLVYRRGGTPWVKAAREKGCRAADGLPMLLEQGALSFQRWFGIEPDREAMRQSLL